MPEDFFSRTLNRCSFRGVEFPCESFDVQGGQDGAEHTAYKGDGADVEPTGRKAYSGTLTVPLYNGVDEVKDWFPEKYYDLLGALEESSIGQLSHPTKGQFDVLMKSWGETGDANSRNGLMLKLSWVEHNASAGKLVEGVRENPEQSVQTDSAAVDELVLDYYVNNLQITDIAQAPDNFPFAESTAASLEGISGKSVTRGQQEQAVRSIADGAAALIVSTDVEGVEAHELVLAAEKMLASAFKLQDKLLPNANSARVYTVPSDMALWQIAKTLYGDASKASLLVSANPIHDPLRVPGGTRLKVPPL